eukprot:1157896-Pelagomonas_calceolata.AAC.5
MSSTPQLPFRGACRLGVPACPFPAAKLPSKWVTFALAEVPGREVVGGGAAVWLGEGASARWRERITLEHACVCVRAHLNFKEIKGRHTCKLGKICVGFAGHAM